MPVSFEQQHELITTFRSVVRSLLAVQIGSPVIFEDLDGDLMRSRVRTCTVRLVEAGFIDETKETRPGGKFSRLVWKVIDESRRNLLRFISSSDENAANFLWSDEETIHEEPRDESPSVEVEAASQDPVALVAQVLEGFNDRLEKMERRQDEVAGGMRELIAAVGSLNAKTKPYDDTELLVMLGEQVEISKTVSAAVQEEAAARQELTTIVGKVALSLDSLEVSLEKLFNDGIQAKNQEMSNEITTMTEVFRKMLESFKNWTPAMKECIEGLKIVNKNHLNVGEEINGMLMTILQAIGAQARGETFKIKAETVAHTSLRSRRAALPSLSAIVAKKDIQKAGDVGHSFDVSLPSSITAQLESVLEPDSTLTVVHGKEK
jgi:hypothetical protein